MQTQPTAAPTVREIETEAVVELREVCRRHMRRLPAGNSVRRALERLDRAAARIAVAKECRPKLRLVEGEGLDPEHAAVVELTPVLRRHTGPAAGYFAEICRVTLDTVERMAICRGIPFDDDGLDEDDRRAIERLEASRRRLRDAGLVDG